MDNGEQALACECLRQAMTERKNLREIGIGDRDEIAYAARLEGAVWAGRVVVVRPHDGGLPTSRNVKMRVEIFAGTDEGRGLISVFEANDVKTAAAAIFKKAWQFARPSEPNSSGLTLG